MSSGQMLLAIGALLLLGKLAVSTLTLHRDSEVSQNESEVISAAAAIGQSALEKICVRGYDHNYPGGDPSVLVSSFVSSASLGVDGGEQALKDTTFNDLDDFRNFRDSVNTPRFGNFYINCNVYYVNDISPYDSTGYKSFLKRVDVSVTNSYMIDPMDPLKIPVPVKVSRYICYN